MPHLIIEFSYGQVGDEQIESMLDAVHRAAAETTLFDESHIRVRAIPVEFYRIGGQRHHFIHLQCRIHTGRDNAQKRYLSEALLQTLKSRQWPAVSITVEVVELERESYAKYSATK
jgi:5-carboxymethyl-2-hydroxymuconate isomerase